VCHAAGRAGTTKYVSITIAPQGAAAHFGNNGTPKAGHELDFLATADRPCNAPEAAQLIICKASSANDPSTADPNVSFSFTTNEGDPFSLKFGECKTFSDLFPEGVTITELPDQNAPNPGSYFATSETEVGGLQVSALGFNSVRPASATNAVENLTTVAGQTATVTFYNRN
jgi:hypothetical protein